MKYYALAKKWDDKRQEQVVYVAGEFPTYINAELFAKAYSEHYSSTVKVVSEYELLNK